jgi:hypothetical protein
MENGKTAEISSFFERLSEANREKKKLMEAWRN